MQRDWAPTIVQSSFARLGYFGVAVFFVISGFLIYRPFVLAHFLGRPAPQLGRFWFRRCARVLPAYWLALIGAWLILGLITMPTPTDVVTYFALLQNYRAGYVYSGLGVAWTLVIEVSFYFAVPGIAWLVRSVSERDASPTAKLRAQLVGLCGLGLISIGFQLWGVRLERSSTMSILGWLPAKQLGTWLVAYLAWFIVGMLMATASAWHAIGGRLPRAIVALGQRSWLAWSISFVFLFVMSRLHYPWVPKFTRVPVSQEFLRFCLSGLAAGFIVFPAAFGDQDVGAIRGMLKNRVIVALGLISYGIYLWHGPLWSVSFRWVGSGAIPSGVVAQFTVVFVLTVACATGSYFLVERPIRIWVQRVTSTRSARARASG